MTGIWGTNEHHFVNSAALLMLLSITMSQDEPAPSEARGPRQGGAGRRATLPASGSATIPSRDPASTPSGLVEEKEFHPISG